MCMKVSEYRYNQMTRLTSKGFHKAADKENWNWLAIVNVTKLFNIEITCSLAP